MITLTFLGTSAGVPTKNRNVTALALQTTRSRAWWLIDCGEATQHQLQHLPLSVHDLAGICITHRHGDHCYGLPGLLASAAMTGRRKPMILAAPLSVRAWVEATLAHTELYLTFPLIHVDVTPGQLVHMEDGLCIERFPLSHRAPSVAYRFTVNALQWKLDSDGLRARGIMPGPEWGRLQQGQDVTLADGTVLVAAQWRHEVRERAVAVIGGDNDTPDLLMEACRGADVLVHEATYTEAALQKVGPGPTHSSALRVADFAARAGLPNLVLTHFSARYDHPAGVAELEAEARQRFTGQLHMAQDLVSYTLHKDGQLQRD